MARPAILVTGANCVVGLVRSWTWTITTISLHPGWVLTEMGGPNAEIDIGESVAGLKSILQQAGPAQNGCFIEYKGQPIPW